jgi:hypothetical protein
MKKLIFAGLAIAMCIGVFSGRVVSADKTDAFGARLGYINCSGCDGAFQIGADYFTPVTEKDDLDVRLNVASEDRFDIWSLSGNYIYNFPVQKGASGSWYAGAGLGLIKFSGNSSSKTKGGVNIMGGYKFTKNVSVEAIYTFISTRDVYGINIGYRF